MTQISITDEALQLSGARSTRKKQLKRGKYLFREKRQQWEQTTSRKGCNHFELLIYPNLNLMNKELILFLKSIFSMRCANRQNISGFIHIRNTIKNKKTTRKSKLLMLIGVFSTVGLFSYTKRTFSYKEQLVSPSDVLESLLQSSIFTYSQYTHQNRLLWSSWFTRLHLPLNLQT